jgi:polyisoprenoid-binding protein YceI
MAETKTLELRMLRFSAPVNVKAFTVRGEAQKFFGSARVQDHGALSELEARVPVESLTTGMKIRDQHMRERIFTTKDGATPDLVFKSTGILCSEESCNVQGTLTIAGKAREQTFRCNRLATFTCTTQVSLTRFEIERPSHLGVKVEDLIEVQVQARIK